MKKGYIHFDLRKGLKADMLNAALAGFLPDISGLNNFFKAIGLKDIRAELKKGFCFDQNGQALRFIYPKPSQEKTFNIRDLREDLKDLDLKKRYLNLIDKIIDTIGLEDHKNHKIGFEEKGYFLLNILTFAYLLEEIDPKYLSSTPIFISSKNDYGPIIKALLLNCPIVEIGDDVIPIDILGLGIIKAFSASFQSRGLSLINAISYGFSDAEKYSSVEAQICEVDYPKTISERGLLRKANIEQLLELSFLVENQVDIKELAKDLFLHGARSINYWLVHTKDGEVAFRLTLVVKASKKTEIIEASLIKAKATELFLRPLESHSLKKRKVSVPLGTKNKTENYIFEEYLYGDKILRVDPLKEDLDLYIKKTNYPPDVARSDLYMAWRKWRGRVFEE